MKALDFGPRPPIAAVEAEAAILGGMMIQNSIIDEARARLLPSHFANALHARMYRVMLKLRDAGDSVNPITLSSYFTGDPLLDDMGGKRYFAEITSSGAGLVGATTFIDQLVRFATFRDLRKTMLDGVERIERSFFVSPDTSLADYEAAMMLDPAEVAADSAADLAKATETAQRVRPRTMSQLLGRVRERHQRAASGESIGARSAVVPDMNDIIGPAAPGQMTIIGGRSGMGKTVLLCSTCWGYAVNGHPTLLISLEMTEDALAMRNAADMTFGMNEPVPFNDMVRNRTTEAQLLQVDEAARRIEAYPLETITPGRVTIEQIRGFVSQWVARLKRKGLKPGVVAIDYAQIVAATGKLEGTARINHISEGALGIAKDFDVHVILLSQLLRDIDKRPDRRPTVADLKESGRLEEDADNVVLVYRPEFYLTKEQPDRNKDQKKWEEWDIEYQASRGRADVIGAKVRMGEPQTRRVKFYGKHQAMRGSEYQEPVYRDENVLLPADGKPPGGGLDETLPPLA